MNERTPSLLVCFILLLSCAVSLAETHLGELEPDRVAAIAQMLPEAPRGFGENIENRDYWTSPSTLALSEKAAQQAEKFLTTSFPAWDDNLYLDYTKTGNRARGEKMEGDRINWLTPLVLAECRENKGRFLPLLNQIIRSFAEQPTWTMAAHDPKLDNFSRKKYDVDLGAAMFGHSYAGALYLLGDRLDPTVRTMALQALQQRLFQPFKEALAGGRTCYWLGSREQPDQNNWNAVCLAGVVGAALAVVPDKNERAIYVAAGEHYPRYYLESPSSFSSDGYDKEGVGYWGYGFGHCAVLREELVEATHGNVDLFASPIPRNIALFGARFRIGPNAVPPFGDCGFGARADKRLMAYCQEVFSLALNMPPFAETAPGVSLESGLLMTATPCTQLPPGGQIALDPLRTFFDQSGVLCCRPDPATRGSLGIGIKAGGNGSHSHNDVGSYAIAIGDEEPTGDPGGGSYDASSFGPKRYEHKLYNSYGHPVPVIDGAEQLEATKVTPVVLSSHFTPEQDQISIDLTPAYQVEGLNRITRTMVYTRSGAGQIEITDEVDLAIAKSFADALITHGDWQTIDAQTLLLSLGQAKLQVTISTPDGFTVKPEQIEDLSKKFTRLGIVLNQPVTKAKVIIRFLPVP